MRHGSKSEAPLSPRLASCVDWRPRHLVINFCDIPLVSAAAVAAQVRDFEVIDSCPLSVCFSWEGKDGSTVTQTLFKRGG